MKITGVLCFLFSLALAAPNQLAKRLPDHTPVTVRELDSSFDVKCGKVTVKGSDIEKAVSWAVNLQDAGETVGRKIQYPHLYKNYEDFNFPSDACKNGDSIRYEFPVVQDGYFDGGNDPEYKFRAIYLYNGEDQDTQFHPMATYCGTIYHGTQGNSFSGCDVTK